MTEILFVLAVLLALPASALLADRVWKERQVGAARNDLVESPGSDEAARFDPATLEDLPEAARRYLLHAIQPGTPVAGSVRLTMPGSIRISRDDDPVAMKSEELLAPARGYVWRASVGRGVKRIRGYDRLVDGEAEMVWWLWGLLPVVRAGGPEVSRSAVGRLLAGSVFLPSRLLPSRGARWEGVAASTARVRIEAHGEQGELTLVVGPDGSLRRMSLPRWNADPKNGPVGYLPFVCDEITEERTFGGYTIPTRFRAGWRLGEDDEFPFFFPRITAAKYR